MAEYQPGVCNIGTEQRHKRLVGGASSFTLAIASVLAVIGFDLPPGAFLVTFVLLFGGFVGYLQARFGFCVAFAALARYDLSGSGGEAGTIAEQEALRRDRKQAVKILFYAAGAAAIMTGVIYGIALVAA